MAKKIPPQNSFVLSLPASPPSKSTDYIKAYRKWTYIAIQAIAREVSSAKLTLHKRRISKNEVLIEPVVEHEALSLLYYPNNHMTMMDLMEITFIYYQSTGEGYWAILRDDAGLPIELWPLRPDWISIIKDEEDFIRSYKYKPAGASESEAVVFERKDIIPFKDLNPADAFRGFGKVRAGANAIDTNDYADDWNRTFFFNSALPGLLLTTDKTLKQSQVEEFMTKWKNEFQGRSNAHKVAFLGGGLKHEKLNISHKDMDFLQLKDKLRDEILATFNVPKVAVGITEDVNRANAEATQRAFLENTVDPIVKKFVVVLNKFYLDEWAEEGIFFDYEDIVPEDTELKLQTYENGMKNYWLTTNEIRELENLPPVEGGDTIYMPFNMSPLGQTLEDAKGKILGLFGKKSDSQSGVVMMKVKEEKRQRKFNTIVPPRRLREIRLERQEQEIKHDLYKLIQLMLRESGVEENKNKELVPLMSEEQTIKYAQMFLEKADVEENRFKEAVKVEFAEQRDRILDRLTTVELAFTAEDIFDLQQEIKMFISALAPLIKEIFIDKGVEALDMLGSPVNFNIATDTAIKFLNEQGLEFATSVNETTREKLRKELAEAFENEESIDQIRQRIQDVYKSATKYRAELIARTEVIRASNAGSFEAYKQSGVVQGKVWIATKDDRVREEHLALDGIVVPLNKSFVSESGISVDYPPLEPNCRCVVAPAVSK